MRLIHGEALTEMRKLALEGVQVDAVICDPPYGTTACKWDNVIPFGLMWELISELRKDKAAVALFGSEPFSTMLRASNIKQFKYDWIWDKVRPGNPMLAKVQPLKRHEIISVFCENNYYPQGIIKTDGHPLGGTNPSKTKHGFGKSIVKKYAQEFTNYPKSIQIFSADNKNNVHPTQKPVDLMEYLVRTYTQPGETVLDFTMGSGSTGVACVKSGRHFIGIEQDAKYFKIAQQRIRNTTLPLF